MISTPNRQAGFTLFELLIATSISVVVIAVVFVAGSTAYRFLLLERVGFELLDETRRAATDIGSAAQQASQIDASYTLAGTTYTTDTDTVVLSLPAYDSGGTRISGAFDRIVVDWAAATGIVSLMTDPAAGSSRQTQTKQPTTRATSLVIRYFTPDGADSDLADELVTDANLYATATRMEAVITTEASAADETIDITRSSSARLRGGS